MILAVADYVMKKGPQPPELKAAFKVRRWGLPRAGGWMDQPAGYLDRTNVLLNIYDAHKSWRSSRNWAEWARTNNNAYRIIQNVITIRKAHGR